MDYTDLLTRRIHSLERLLMEAQEAEGDDLEELDTLEYAVDDARHIADAIEDRMEELLQEIPEEELGL